MQAQVSATRDLSGGFLIGLANRAASYLAFSAAGGKDHYRDAPPDERGRI